MTASATNKRSFKLVRFGEPFCETIEPLPEPSGTQVLVRVAACGLCHSDIHLADGYFDLGQDKRLDMARALAPPRTLGHEIAGTVAATGPDVEGVAIGDERVVFPWIGCGNCAVCRRGQEHLCARPQSLGTTADGGFADHVLVPHPRYLLAYDPLPTAYAATLACSGLTAYSAVRKAGDLAEEAVVVIGAGGVGLAAVSIVTALGGKPPFVVDVDPAKRAAALEAGAAEAFDPADQTARKRLVELTDGGAVAAIDFVGARATAEFGLSVIRKGGKLIAVGLFGGQIEVALPMVPIRAIAIEGSYVGSLEEMTALVELARRGALKPIPLETRPLDGVVEALEDLRKGRIRGRAVMQP